MVVVSVAGRWATEGVVGGVRADAVLEAGDLDGYGVWKGLGVILHGVSVTYTTRSFSQNPKPNSSKICARPSRPTKSGFGGN